MEKFESFASMDLSQQDKKHTHNTIVKCSYLCNLHFTTPFKHKRKVYHLNILVKYIVLKRHQVFHCDVVPILNIKTPSMKRFIIECVHFVKMKK